MECPKSSFKVGAVVPSVRPSSPWQPAHPSSAYDALPRSTDSLLSAGGLGIFMPSACPSGFANSGENDFT